MKKKKKKYMYACIRYILDCVIRGEYYFLVNSIGVFDRFFYREEERRKLRRYQCFKISIFFLNIEISKFLTKSHFYRDFSSNFLI